MKNRDKKIREFSFPTLYKVIPFGVFLFFSIIPFILAAVNSVGGVRENFYWRAFAEACPILLFAFIALVVWLPFALWKVEMYDEYFIYRNYFGIKKKYRYEDLTINTTKAWSKTFFYLNGKKVLSIAYWIEGEGALAKRIKQKRKAAKKPVYEILEENSCFNSKEVKKQYSTASRYNEKPEVAKLKQKFKKIALSCLGILCAGVVFSALMLIINLTDKPVSYGELTPVTGKLQYVDEKLSYRKHGGGRYIAIAIQGNDTEFRLQRMYLDEFDYSFFSEVKAGDTITIYRDNSKNREFSSKYTYREEWNNFYVLKTKTKTYFSYDDYLKGHTDNQNVVKIILLIGMIAIGSMTVTIVIAYCVYKTKKERILR